ncbi:hypothetical protein [Microvirga sp. VF16]|uniref:hypothetical protein n=1 Tax=Microvirga sp. VF16 TaxID=2807101 RepID=UPI00193E86A0|nr:hypothetical protein [Microvirga sp. VF16]QRM35555.1 hypothetical protein JO965_45330 [Microvirga sp. VF16]
MNWRLFVPPAVIILAWSIHLAGVLDLPGWEGFSRGMALGALFSMSFLEALLVYRHWKGLY